MFIKLEVYHSSTISDYTTNNFYSLQRFNRQKKKAADGGWNVEVSRNY